MCCFFEILASTYGPRLYGPGPFGPYGPGPLIILKNIRSYICSRTIFEKHSAPGAHSKHAPGAVYILNMVLEHIWLRKFFQIMNGPGPYVQDHRVLMVQDHIVLDHKFEAKIFKKLVCFAGILSIKCYILPCTGSRLSSKPSPDLCSLLNGLLQKDPDKRWAFWLELELKTQ